MFLLIIAIINKIIVQQFSIKYYMSEYSNSMSLALLFHYLMLNMFRILIHPSSGACDLFVDLFHGLWDAG